MLILSRKNCESVMIGDPAGGLERMLKVTVLEIGRGTVRLGFEVAGDVPVNRWEVLERIRANARSLAPVKKSHAAAVNRCVRSDHAPSERHDQRVSRSRGQQCHSEQPSESRARKEEANAQMVNG
jgi:carbon storage regulator CsrA